MILSVLLQGTAFQSLIASAVDQEFCNRSNEQRSQNIHPIIVNSMEVQLLKEQTIFPSEEVLKDALGGRYPVFESLIETIISVDYGLSYEWNFYKDGKSWLCKVCNKKKTVFWLSVWDGYFKISFFFTGKHLEGIAALDIAPQIKDAFYKEKPIGRLIPMIFNIHKEEQLHDLLKVVDFKKKSK